MVEFRKSSDSAEFCLLGVFSSIQRAQSVANVGDRSEVSDVVLEPRTDFADGQVHYTERGLMSIWATPSKTRMYRRRSNNWLA